MSVEDRRTCRRGGRVAGNSLGSKLTSETRRAHLPRESWVVGSGDVEVGEEDEDSDGVSCRKGRQGSRGRKSAKREKVDETRRGAQESNGPITASSLAFSSILIEGLSGPKSSQSMCSSSYCKEPERTKSRSVRRTSFEKRNANELTSSSPSGSKAYHPIPRCSPV